jgi:hypothetical protein
VKSTQDRTVHEVADILRIEPADAYLELIALAAAVIKGNVAAGVPPLTVPEVSALSVR